jgi:hypothetical protein
MLQIILALSASVIPVANAFFILLIVIAICESEPRVISTPPPWFSPAAAPELFGSVHLSSEAAGWAAGWGCTPSPCVRPSSLVRDLRGAGPTVGIVLAWR